MSPYSSTTRSPYDTFQRVGIGISLVLHLLFIASLNREWVPAKSIPPLSIEVSFEPQKKAPAIEEQIVSPPVERNENPDAQNLKLSDRDNTVIKEQIKRGENEKALPAPRGKVAPPAPAQKAQPKAEPKREAQRKESPKGAESSAPIAPLSSLALDNATLLDKFGGLKPSDDPAGVKRPQSASSTNLSAYQAFSRPFGSGAMFMGAPGSADFLPNLPDGDITLLNTKASQFAVFVRRVATQVFAQIRLQGWDYLASGDINSISDFSTVRASLSPEGKLIRVTLETPSGSSRFDAVISDAAKKGAADPNPPTAAAAPDGNFYFIFKAKSWSRGATNPKTGAPTERRWLLLATGLE